MAGVTRSSHCRRAAVLPLLHLPLPITITATHNAGVLCVIKCARACVSAFVAARNRDSAYLQAERKHSCERAGHFLFHLPYRSASLSHLRCPSASPTHPTDLHRVRTASPHKLRETKNRGESKKRKKNKQTQDGRIRSRFASDNEGPVQTSG